MNKKQLLYILIGWLIAFVFPPQALLGMVKGRGA